MSQDREKYLYFTVGLLKDSSTLDALWQDALKYHMIDQPGKLIALRLTEHYEMIAQEGLHAAIPMTPTPKASANGHYQRAYTQHIPRATMAQILRMSIIQMTKALLLPHPMQNRMRMKLRNIGHNFKSNPCLAYLWPQPFIASRVYLEQVEHFLLIGYQHTSVAVARVRRHIDTVCANTT